MNKDYEIVAHTADLKIRAYGTTMQELFRNALKGMFSSIKPQGAHVTYKDDQPVVTRYSVEHHVVVRSLDQATLLIDFLSECLYLSDVHNEAYFDAQFKVLSQTEVDSMIFGVHITGYEVVEIKAVTYHDLDLELIDGIWCATIVFDI